MKILVGYDGSEYAADAIRDLHRAGIPQDADALVVSSADVVMEVPFPGCEQPDSPYHHVPPAVVDAARATAKGAMSDARASARSGADLVTREFPGWKVLCDAMADTPCWALPAKAKEWHADLLVVGSHGRSLVGRIVLGSVSQAVAMHSPCSIRIGRRSTKVRERRDEPVRIVLGIDGSVDSATAVEAVRIRKWPAGTEVHVVTAVDMKLVASDFAGWSGASDQQAPLTHVARRRAASVTRELGEAGLAAEPFVAEGDPKGILVHHAEHWDADCLIVGAKGHSARERLFMGSVSAAVAARAHCSVEIVRTPA